MKEGKKNSKALLVGIIAAVLVLAGLLVLLLTQCVGGWGEGSAPTSAPATEPEKCDIYWNMDRSEYGGKSEAGMSSRKPEADGYWHIRFFLDGQEVTLKTETRQLVNTIDSMDVMGLTFDEEGMITGVTNLDEMPVERVGWQFYVQSVARTVIKLNSSNKFNGMEVMLEDVDPNRIWDMTGISGPKGRVAELIKYDKVMALADVDGNITHVFIYDRPNYMLSHEGTCMHCEGTVVWNEWTKTDALPTDTGHYQLQNNVKVKSQVSPLEEAKICLDLNGCRVEGPNNSRLIIMNKPSIELAIMDTSEAQTGVIAPRGNGNMGMGIMVKHGALSLYSGTIDASKVVNTSGAAISVSKGRFFYMYGGKIIGGEAKCVQNPDTGAFESGAGGALYVSGKFVMHDGIIENGRATSIVSYKNGSRIYNRGLGGNIYLASGSEFEMNGGTIRGGQAGSYGGNIGSDGMTLITINGGYIQGGMAVTDTSATDAKTATVYINGAPKITDGPNGLDLTISSKRVVVNVGSLYGGAKIGINAKHGIFTKPTKAENVDKFYSNIQDAQIVHFEGCLGLGRLRCICGKETHTLGCDGKTLLWVPHNTMDLPAATGNYYLTKDLSLKKGYVVAPGEEVKLDLNGHNVTYNVPTSTTAGFRLYRSDNESILTITDTTDAPGTLKTVMPAAGTKYTGKPLLKSETDGEKIYFEAGSPEEQAEAERLWAQGDYGSLLWARGGVINIVNGIFDGSNLGGTREQGGMVIYVASSTATDEATGLKTTYPATLNLYGGTIKGGQINAPGNVIVKEGAVLNMHGGTIEGGKANKGGALYVSGTANILGGTIQGGTSVTDANAAAEGGNIYVSLSGVLNVEGGTITGGKGSVGGNIFAYGAVKVTGGTVEKGEATSCGGNIGTNSGKSTILVGGNAIVQDGYALRGGNLALYVRGNKDFTVEGNAQILNGEAKESGGNLFVASWLDEPSNVKMTGGLVSGGKAPMGGNVYVGGSSSGSHATFTATGGTIEKGDCTNGANIAVGHASATVTLKGVTVHNTKESAYNLLVELGTLNIAEGTKITNEAASVTNIRTSPTADTVSGVVMTGGTVSGGTNSNLSIYSGDTLTVSGGSIEGGKAGDGGNIKINSATLNLTGGTVTGGEATGGVGGNIYVGNGTAVITGGLIEKGTAKTAGGNVGTNNATSQITIGGDAVIQNGYANRGGNVAVHSEPNNGLTIEGNALITGGKAYTAGGNLSLYLGSAAKKSGTVVMTGGKIEKGEAPYGGNVNLKGKDADNTAAFVFAGGTIENGTSVNYGANIYTKNDFTALELSGSVNGGVYVTGGKITLKGAPVIDKTGTAYAYSILLPEGNAMDVKDLTGGKVYVTAQIGAVIATNAASEELTGYVLSEVTDEDDALVPVIWNEKDSTLLMGQIVETHCTCGADSENKYECHCADADKGALEWHAWESADSLPTTTGNYYLKGNVDLSAQTDAKPEADAVIRIDLMGHQILLENAENLYDFTDVTNVRLVITDSTEQPGAVVLTGTDTVTGGILKLTATNTFVLYRATMDVSGFAVGALDGGLAYINSDASFLMHSGNLVGKNDGRVLHVNGNAELYGGTVSGGLINIRTGNANAKVKLSGVTVTNAVANATSIRMDYGELTIEEGTVITNTADGATNVVTTDSNASRIIMTGGTISGGTSNNVNLKKGDSFTMSGGTIQGGVQVNAEAQLILKNAPTIDKGDSGLAYSVTMADGVKLNVTELTGGKVLVTGNIGRVIAENVTTDLSSYICADSAEAKVTWDQTDHTLVLETAAYCTCGATKRGAYDCHCAEADKTVQGWTAWEGTDALPTATGNYYLKGNVDLSTVSKPEADAVIRIDLMGHQILLENAENLYDFTDVTNVRLVITDSTEQPGAVVLTGTDTVTGGILKLTSANTFVLYRATMDVSGFAVGALDGGLAYINSGASFLMHSGNLVGRNDGRMLHVNGNAELYGGTVSGGLINIRTGNANAKVKLSGVTVTNAVANATSIRMDHGELTIEEGTAIINTADGATNVATTDSNASRIVMTGGTISGGKNSNVRLKFNDSFTMSGGTVTGGSAANGGNFYLEGSTDAFATLTVTGGTIEKGSTTASRTGANIRLNNGYTKLIVDGATIPGGIHANSSATITLKNNVTIDKGDSGLDYSLRMGDNARLIVGELTGGQILIYKDNSGKVIAENVETDLSGFFFCDKSNFKIDYNASAKTLVHNTK